MAAGTMYRINPYQIGKITRPALDDIITSLARISRFIFVETNTEINRAPIGINRLLARKSIVSKMVLPKTDTSPRMPKERADGMPSKKTKKPAIQETFLRFPSP